jgi:hypothetical protein
LQRLLVSSKDPDHLKKVTAMLRATNRSNRGRYILAISGRIGLQGGKPRHHATILFNALGYA